MRFHTALTKPPSGGFVLCQARGRGQRGFTLVELVMVMMLVAVITAMSAARFADREPFAVQGAADQLVSGLRLAQATAIAQRRAVQVVLVAQPAALTVCFDDDCKEPLLTPAGDSTWLADANELSLSADARFSFQPDGSTTLDSTLELKVLGHGGVIGSPAITIEAGSGHVHTP